MPSVMRDDPLPAPTRAVRPESAQKTAKAGPPYKLLLAAAAFFLMVCVVLMGLGLYFGLETAKEYGYDPELAKKYPTLAGFIVGIKNAKIAEDIVIDKENGIVTYRDKRSGRKFKVQEAGGNLTHEMISEKTTDPDSEEEAPKPKPKARKKPAEKEILDNKF